MEKSEPFLLGSKFKLPLLQRIASIRSHSAARLTWHSHDCYELLLVMEGATAYEFRDGSTANLPGGHFLVIPPTMEHRGLHDVRRPARLTGLMVDPTRKNAARNSVFSACDLAWLVTQFSKSIQPVRMSPELREFVRSLPEDLNAAITLKEPSMASLRMVVCGILLESARQLAFNRSFEPELVVGKVIEFMKTNLSTSLSMQDVAESVNCNRSKLFDIFKESTGMTPNDYWQRLRIDRAQELLLGSERAITEIAFDCGFTSSQYFSAVFRKYSGTTPTDYRQSQAGYGRSRP